MINDEIARLARSEQDQYFLTSPTKLSLLVQAAGIQPTDHVVEVGAGVGTVARALPSCASLTLIELDGRFTEIIRDYVPHAQVIQGDGLTLLEEMKNLRCDVLLSNLPTSLSETLIDLLPVVPFRTAVITMAPDTQISQLRRNLVYEVVASIGGDDFQPAQPTESVLVKITRAQPARIV